MTASRTAPERTIRAEIGRGDPLPERLREPLERAYGAGLDRVRLHDDATADGLAQAAHADAFTAGADVFFRAGALRPDSDVGVELLAHEVAHVVQQAASPGAGETREAEAEATAWARAFVGGGLPDRARHHRAGPLGADEPLVVQRHSSWEHRMLGDLRALDFGAIAGGGDSRKAYLRRVQTFLHMWFKNPKLVTAERIRSQFPDIRTVQLAGSGLVVTYGELNTLADYVATPADLDRMPEANLLPILQQVRQEGYAWVTWVIEGEKVTDKLFYGGFEGSVANTSGNDSADAVWETFKMNAHTEAFGPRGVDHYEGLLSRNACHFAPHSWYRWEQFYLRARAFAVEAHHATGARKLRLENLAWIHHGYADHFLHDSFAAGHLVNKTLVMQWFVDWGGSTSMPVPDWDLVQFMTLDRQPDLAGQKLYSAFGDPTARGEVRDPQTASEQWSLARRMAVAGIRADGSTLESSYKRWLAFLGAGVVQLASNIVHDHFNAQSLWVSSKAHQAAFQIFGDNTMIKGGKGYQLAGATAQLSQQSIIELLAAGTTTVTSADIAAQFPSTVHDAERLDSSQPLEDWAYGYKDDATRQFDGVKSVLVGSIRKRLSPVNIDHTGGWVWQTGSLEGQPVLDVAVGGDGVAWSIGALGADGNGPVQRWTGVGSGWVKRVGAGVRIAADGAGVLWLVNAAGDSFRQTPGSDNWEKGQRPTVADKDAKPVQGLLEIAAGTDGSVWGLAKATVAGGYRLMRCVPGSGTHTWETASGGATAVSVAPDGLPWVVNDGGVVMFMIPGTGPERYRDGVRWIDVTPYPRKAVDIGLGTGTLLHAWITTDQGPYAWNGRQTAQQQPGDRQLLGWEAIDEPAWHPGTHRIAAGPDGLPWVVFRSSTGAFIRAGSAPTAAFTTTDAGKVTGTALAKDGSLFQGESVSINGFIDLSNVIVGNSGARVHSIRLDRSPLPGVFYRLCIDGQGPRGAGSGYLYVYIEDEGHFTEYKGFWSSDRHTLTIDYNGSKAGITRISWSAGNDPRPPR